MLVNAENIWTVARNVRTERSNTRRKSLAGELRSECISVLTKQSVNDNIMI